MTSVLDATETSAAESPLLNPEAARRDFQDLVAQIAARIMTAVSDKGAGVRIQQVASIAATDPATTGAADPARVWDAFSEAVLQLLSAKQLAVTVDQRLVAVPHRGQ